MTTINSPHQLTMPGSNPALVPAFQDGMRGNQSAVLEDATSSARVCTSTTRFRVALGTL
jgi:hypothetical protein